MTAAADIPGALDRIVFARTAAGEMRAVGSSLSAAELACWAEHLHTHVSVDRGVDRGDQPPASLRYSSEDGGAALLRRMHGSDRAGDRCHALVGWPADLTPELGLRMHSWAGWTDAAWRGPELQRLDLARWRPPDVRHGDLDRTATAQLTSLVALVAAVLRDPRRPVSIVSGPASLAGRIALLWGLRAVVGDLLDVPGEPPYTFSTFEACQAGAGSMVVRVAFVPPEAFFSKPSGVLDARAFTVTSTIVRLPVVNAGRSDVYSHAARALVHCYVRGGVPAVREWLDQRQARISHSVMDRVDRVVETAEAAAIFPPGSPGLRSIGSTVPEEPKAVAATGTTSGTVVPFDDVELALLGDAAPTPDTVRRVLHAITRRATTGDARRAQIRELVTRHRSWERLLRDTLPPAEARAAVDGLVRLAFQPADLGDDEVVGDIQRLVTMLDASSLVFSSLVALMVEYGELSVLLEAAGVRWMREHGYPVTAPVRTPLGRQGGPHREPRWRSHLSTPVLHSGRSAAPRSRVSRREI